MTTEPLMNEFAVDIQQLIQSRQTTLPKRLGHPGPSAKHLYALFKAAAAAPDHEQIQPWRCVLVPPSCRPQLADVFAQALTDRDPGATEEQVAQAREKAFRAPLLLLVVVDSAKGDPSVDMGERLIATGCAIQNMLILATAMGFGSGLTSGKALESSVLRDRFGLNTNERAVCFISVGTITSRKAPKSRYEPHEFVSTWNGLPGSCTHYFPDLSDANI